MTARLLDAHRTGIRVVTSSMTLIEAHHSGVKRAAWRWAMSRIVVEPVTHRTADEAIALLAETGLHGHTHAIDAALAVIARRLPGNVVLYTSDPDDLKTLCGDQVLIKAL
ncbi:hypothetical protein [Streptomyces chumphonensis]|nr:hypothetical protein [Streptomyces chumphonensis]